MRMNYTRIALAAIGGFVAYFVVGGLMFVLLPLKSEFLKYPAVYRDQNGQLSHMASGMAWMFVSILALTLIYASAYRGGSGTIQGLRFGALIGIFSIGAFVAHNYVNLNIGIRLTIQSALAYLVEWIVAGLVVGLIYRPSMPPPA
jgi:hypothetical protein